MLWNIKNHLKKLEISRERISVHLQQAGASVATACLGTQVWHGMSAGSQKHAAKASLKHCSGVIGMHPDLSKGIYTDK